MRERGTGDQSTLEARLPAKRICKHAFQAALSWAVHCLPHYRDVETEAQRDITANAEEDANSHSTQEDSLGPKLKNELLRDLGQILRF